MGLSERVIGPTVIALGLLLGAGAASAFQQGFAPFTSNGTIYLLVWHLIVQGKLFDGST